ncbi:MAG: hypothetical protein M3168_00595 [Actinomycetota bacterium]|nr:hypothetical protein [Actinomycetota bacterium]
MPDERRNESDVLLDVDFAGGLLFLAVENIGALPAHRVRVRIDPPLRGLGGRRRFDRLALFSRLELLAPGKRIRVFLDRASLYFARDEPTRLTATVTWRTDAGEKRERVVRHDLGIYRDLAYVHTEVPERADEA